MGYGRCVGGDRAYTCVRGLPVIEKTLVGVPSASYTASKSLKVLLSVPVTPWYDSARRTTPSNPLPLAVTFMILDLFFTDSTERVPLCISRPPL